MPFFKDKAQFEKVRTAWDLSVADSAGSPPEDPLLKGIGDLLIDPGTMKAISLNDSWRQAGINSGENADFTNKETKKTILKALGLYTDCELRAAGITDESIINDPTRLMDDKGYLRGFDQENGLSKDQGEQIKVLVHYDSNNKAVGIAVLGLATNDAADTPGKDQEGDLTISKKFDYVLKALEAFASAHSIAAADILFAGISAGGAITNSFHNHTRGEGNFFKSSYFVGIEAPTISKHDTDGQIFNLGFENDVVYAMWEQGHKEELSHFSDLRQNSAFLIILLTAYGDYTKKGNASPYYNLVTDNIALFDDEKYFVKSGPNNLVSFDDAYNIGGAWPTSNNKATSLVGWATHMLSMISNAPQRIYESEFHDDMERDSVIVLSNLSNLTREWSWVYDKYSPTSDHFGKDAFILGTENNDRLKDGSGNDKLEGRAGDDWFWLSTGNDTVRAGEYGTDKVILAGSTSDYQIVNNGGRHLTLYSQKYGTKELYEVEKLDFLDDLAGNIDNAWWDGGGHYTIDSGKIARPGDLFNWFGYSQDFATKIDGTLNDGTDKRDAIFGKGGNDTLHGYGDKDLLDGGDGNDKLYGGHGDDLIWGGGGDDEICGDQGNDQLTGGEGNDLLYGGDGFDIVRGGSGDDKLWGENGNDELHGGFGDDTLSGGAGNDMMSGGAGKDSFYFSEASSSWEWFILKRWGQFGTDTISDFSHTGEDVLKFDKDLWGGNTKNMLAWISDTAYGAQIAAGPGGNVVLTGWTAAQFTTFVVGNPNSIQFV